MLRVLFIAWILASRAACADPLLPLLGGELLRQGGLAGGAGAQTREAIFRQRAELTCGPAALASLLTFYYGAPCTEDEIAKLAGTYERLGTSMLGLRDACRALGHEATGYRLSMARLEGLLRQSGLPVLAHYKTPLEHFVLVVAVVGDDVLVSDPSSGSVALARRDFERRWSGTILVVTAGPGADRARVARRVRDFVTRRDTLDASTRNGFR